MTRAEEKILAYVRECNALGALAGLEASRFVERLAHAGEIIHVTTARLGAGWVTKENATLFQEKV